MHTLPALPFSPDSLAPYINEQTINIHHGKHHQAYITKLNELLADLPELQNLSLVELIQNIDKAPEHKRIAIFNNAGQSFNHNLYWESLAPKGQGGLPSGKFGEAIDGFESYENFMNLWKEAGISQFGSGWVWLCVDKQGKLSIEKTSNADSPLTKKLTPILVMDVWEHAYYLDYQNKRPDYIDNFFEIINWTSAQAKYDTATNGI